MSFDQLVDSYDWKARLVPTVIVLLPLLVTTYYCFPILFANRLLLMGSGIVSIALVYFASMLIRYLGLLSQDAVWKSWGGPPSTRFARWGDNRFSEEQKDRLRKAVAQHFRIRLLNLDEEIRDPEAADQLIGKAFQEVKEVLRTKAEASLVDKHNAEYGFARNLYGSRYVFIGLSVLGIL